MASDSSDATPPAKRAGTPRQSLFMRRFSKTRTHSKTSETPEQPGTAVAGPQDSHFLSDVAVHISYHATFLWHQPEVLQKLVGRCARGLSHYVSEECMRTAVHLSYMRTSRASELERKYDCLTTVIVEHLRELDRNAEALEMRILEVEAVFQDNEYPDSEQKAEQFHNVLGIHNLVTRSLKLLRAINDVLDSADSERIPYVFTPLGSILFDSSPEETFKLIVRTAAHLQEVYKDDAKVRDMLFVCRQDILLWSGDYFDDEPMPLDKMFHYKTPERIRLRDSIMLCFGKILAFQEQSICSFLAQQHTPGDDDSGSKAPETDSGDIGQLRTSLEECLVGIENCLKTKDLSHMATLRWATQQGCERLRMSNEFANMDQADQDRIIADARPDPYTFKRNVENLFTLSPSIRSERADLCDELDSRMLVTGRRELEMPDDEVETVLMLLPDIDVEHYMIPDAEELLEMLVELQDNLPPGSRLRERSIPALCKAVRELPKKTTITGHRDSILKHERWCLNLWVLCDQLLFAPEDLPAVDPGTPPSRLSKVFSAVTGKKHQAVKESPMETKVWRDVEETFEKVLEVLQLGLG